MCCNAKFVTYNAQSKMLTSIKQRYYAEVTEDEVEAMVGLMYDGLSLGKSYHV